MIQVKSLQNLGPMLEKGRIWPGIENIFFESSVKKKFESPEERAAFKFKYLDWYAKNHSGCFFVALDQDQKVQGYICGVPNTSLHPELNEMHPWFQKISHLFTSFPAHLHINCAEKARGLGLGSTLLNVFENTIHSQGIIGVHLVTSPDSRNVGFYDRNGYKFSQTVEWKTASLLFMGKTL